jgi:hypothetical protein
LDYDWVFCGAFVVAWNVYATKVSGCAGVGYCCVSLRGGT